MNSTNNSLLEDKATVKTQAKLSGDSYQLTQARLKHLMIVSPVVIYSCNPEGNFDLKFVSDNIENQLDINHVNLLMTRISGSTAFTPKIKQRFSRN